MKDYISYLNGVIPDKDCLKIVKSEAEKFRSSHINQIIFRYRK